MLHSVSKGVVYSGRHSLSQIRGSHREGGRVGHEQVHPQGLQSLTLEPVHTGYKDWSLDLRQKNIYFQVSFFFFFFVGVLKAWLQC